MSGTLPIVQPPVRHGLPLLDGLRGLAAVLVVVTHVGFQTGRVAHGALGALIARCDVGVAIFFVLSGFLLTRPWLSEGRGSVDPKTYARRRAARILPAYWIALVVVLLTTARGTPPGATAVNATLLQVYTGDLLPGYTQTWSLCTEVAFYLLLPFVAPLVVRHVRTRRAGVTMLTATVLVTSAWIVLAASAVIPRRAGEWLPGHLDWFALGMLLAVAEAQRRRSPTGVVAAMWAEIAARPWGLLALVGAAYWLASTPAAGPRSLTPATAAEAIVKECLYAVVSLGLVLWAVTAHGHGGLCTWLFDRPVSQALGRLSYGVFLWHLVVMAGVFAVFDLRLFTGGFWWVLVLTLLGSVLVAQLSWSLLERPVLAWAHRPRALEHERRPGLRPA